MALSELGADFSISESMRTWAEINTPRVNIDREHVVFVNYWKSKKRRMHDWVRTWQNWMIRCPTMNGCLYTADEVRLMKLRREYEACGFRLPHAYENSVMYECAYIAWEKGRAQGLAMRDMDFIPKLAARLK